MLRSKPLGRNKELDPGKPLTRNTPLKSQGELARHRKPVSATAIPRKKHKGRSETQSRPRNTGPSGATRAEVMKRDGWECMFPLHDVKVPRLVTATWDGWSLQHRKNRGMGGRHGEMSVLINLPSDQILMCGSGTTGCHGWIETTAEGIRYAKKYGWSIPVNSSIDPADEPILTHKGWRRLDNFGGYIDLPDYQIPTAS